MDHSLRNFTIDDTKCSVQDVLSKLKFLSKIQRGEKIDTRKLEFINDSYYNRALRTISPRESRDHSMNFIRGVTDEALVIATKAFSMNSQFEKDIGMMILCALKEMKAGVLNLGGTYDDDRMAVSRIETFLEILDAKITELETNANVKPLSSSVPVVRR